MNTHSNRLEPMDNQNKQPRNHLHHKSIGISYQHASVFVTRHSLIEIRITKIHT